MKMQAMLSEICSDSGDVQFHNFYSGRGMYRKQCIGIVGDHSYINQVLGEAIKQCKDDPDFDEIVDALLNYKMDNMGLSLIAYWPELAPMDDEDEEEET